MNMARNHRSLFLPPPCTLGFRSAEEAAEEAAAAAGAAAAAVAAAAGEQPQPRRAEAAAEPQPQQKNQQKKQQQQAQAQQPPSTFVTPKLSPLVRIPGRIRYQILVSYLSISSYNGRFGAEQKSNHDRKNAAEETKRNKAFEPRRQIQTSQYGVPLFVLLPLQL